MILDNVVITANDPKEQSGFRIARLNRLLGALAHLIGCADAEVVSRTGLQRLHDHKGELTSVWATDVDMKIWSSVLTNLWWRQFCEYGHTASTLLTDDKNVRSSYYDNYLKGNDK